MSVFYVSSLIATKMKKPVVCTQEIMIKGVRAYGQKGNQLTKAGDKRESKEKLSTEQSENIKWQS